MNFTSEKIIVLADETDNVLTDLCKTSRSFGMVLLRQGKTLSARRRRDMAHCLWSTSKNPTQDAMSLGHISPKLRRQGQSIEQIRLFQGI